MIFIPVILALISLISPNLGLLFSMLYCGKAWLASGRRQLLALGLFTLLIIAVAYYENSLSVWLNASDAIVGVGLGMLLYMFFIRWRFDLNKAFFVLLGYEIVYSYARSVIFAPTFSVLAQQMIPVYEDYFRHYPQIHMNKETLYWMQTIWLQYQTAIWSSIQIVFAFLGLLVFNTYSTMKLAVRAIRFPYYLVYVLLVAMALTAMQQFRTYGLNLIAPVAMLYLIQGTGVLSHFWGNIFAKSRMMRAFLIIAIILNYPILVLIAFIGVLDVWFDFRKLNIMEEKT